MEIERMSIWHLGRRKCSNAKTIAVASWGDVARTTKARVNLSNEIAAMARQLNLGFDVWMAGGMRTEIQGDQE